MNMSQYLNGQSSYNPEVKEKFRKNGRKYLNSLAKELVKLSPKLKFQSNYNAGGIACSGDHTLDFGVGEFFFNADCCGSVDSFFAVFRSKDGTRTGQNNIVNHTLFNDIPKLAQEIAHRLSL